MGWRIEREQGNRAGLFALSITTCVQSGALFAGYGRLLATSRFVVVKNELSTAPMFMYQESGPVAWGPGIEATEV
jgi:hypothetical protein